MISVLHISHPWGGGVASYLEDLQLAAGDDVRHLIMQCWQGMITLSFPAAEKRPPEQHYLGRQLGIGDLTDRDYANILAFILNRHAVDIVQIDSHVGHCFDIFTVPPEQGCPVILVVHDFFYLCPTFHLVDRDGRFCGICPAGKENTACLHNHPYLYSSFDAEGLRSQREHFRRLLPRIDLLIFPSRTAQRIFTDFYPLGDTAYRIIPHGSPLEKSASRQAVVEEGPLKVALLGTLSPHKGRRAFEQIVSRLQGDEKIRFYHYGDETPAGLPLVSRGRYSRHAIVELIRQDAIDLILLLSSWPETFSYTLSEAIAAGVPVIVPNIGALGERVEESGTGWTIAVDDVSGCCTLLRQLAADRHALRQRRENMRAFPLKPLTVMANEYLELYRSLPRRAQPVRGDEEKIPFSPLRRTMGQNMSLWLIRLRGVAFKIQTRLSAQLRRLFK